jgi:hypothetical protein
VRGGEGVRGESGGLWRTDAGDKYVEDLFFVLWKERLQP